MYLQINFIYYLNYIVILYTGQLVYISKPDFTIKNLITGVLSYQYTKNCINGKL